MSMKCLCGKRFTEERYLTRHEATCPFIARRDKRVRDKLDDQNDRGEGSSSKRRNVEKASTFIRNLKLPESSKARQKGRCRTDQTTPVRPIHRLPSGLSNMNHRLRGLRLHVQTICRHLVYHPHSYSRLNSMCHPLTTHLLNRNTALPALHLPRPPFFHGNVSHDPPGRRQQCNLHHFLKGQGHLLHSPSHRLHHLLLSLEFLSVFVELSRP